VCLRARLEVTGRSSRRRRSPCSLAAGAAASGHDSVFVSGPLPDDDRQISLSHGRSMSAISFASCSRPERRGRVWHCRRAYDGLQKGRTFCVLCACLKTSGRSADHSRERILPRRRGSSGVRPSTGLASGTASDLNLLEFARIVAANGPRRGFRRKSCAGRRGHTTCFSSIWPRPTARTRSGSRRVPAAFVSGHGRRLARYANTGAGGAAWHVSPRILEGSRFFAAGPQHFRSCFGQLGFFADCGSARGPWISFCTSK